MPSCSVEKLRTTGTVALAFDDSTLFTVLDSFVEWTAANNMSFVIDYHEYDNSYNATSAKDNKYIQMMAETWKHVAAHYAENTREDIFFELLNEPDMSAGKVTAAQWTVAAQAMIDSIRSVDKKHTILFGDAQWYSISLLAKRTPFTDDNIVYVIHTYEPFAPGRFLDGLRHHQGNSVPLRSGQVVYGFWRLRCHQEHSELRKIKYQELLQDWQ